MIPFLPFSGVTGAFGGRDDIQNLPSPLLQLKQIHSDQIIVLDQQKKLDSLQGIEGDAIISTVAGIAIAVRTADCVPILIAHPLGLVAAVHAGWRGTRAKILQKTLLKIKEILNDDLSQIHLAVGPAICVGCYEVGDEVARQFLGTDAGCHPCESRGPFESNWTPAFAGVTKGEKGKYLLDLKLANQKLALAVGVPSTHIQIRKECTLCHEKNFFSYRGAMKRGEIGEGRNYSWVMKRVLK